MQDLLQQLDLDYYRSALLLVARAELERLRQERSTDINVEGRLKPRSARHPRQGGGPTRSGIRVSLPCGGRQVPTENRGGGVSGERVV